MSETEHSRHLREARGGIYGAGKGNERGGGKKRSEVRHDVQPAHRLRLSQNARDHRRGRDRRLQRVTWIITDWYRSQFYYDTGSWRATWAGEGGGVLINQCPHQLDLIGWVVGQMPKKVRGFCHYGKWHDIEVEDDVTAYLEYENGATGVFVTTTGETPGTNRFEVSGTGGKLLCEGGALKWYKNASDSAAFSLETKEFFGRPKCECVAVETDGKNPQHAGIINNFANALLGKEDFFVDGREGLNGVELMNAIELSGWQGGRG
ncbi:MAG: Gfo/Idh/MocA family protein [Christensenellaceae bacterium]